MDIQFIKNKGFKNWYKNIDHIKQGLCESDDIDSHASCIVLNKLFDIDVLGFFSFHTFYIIKIDNMTDEQLEILISIDTAFKQFFFDKDLFTYYYRDVLEYPELVDIVSKHDKNYFYNIIKKYNLHEKIYVDEEGHLQTKIKLDELGEIFGIDLSLPDGKFIPIQKFQDVGINYNKLKRSNINDNMIFSSAMTNKNYVKLSLKI